MERFFLILLLATLANGHGQSAATNDLPGSSSSSALDNAAVPAVDPAKEAEARKLIDHSGVKATMKGVFDRMIQTYRTKYPAVPADFWTQVDSDACLDDLISRLVPVYAQYYSLEDLKAINAFYESPVGLRMTAAQQNIIAASRLVGQQWGRETGAKIMSGVLAEEAKTYAAEDKKTYYTALSTNNPPTSAAPASAGAINAPSPAATPAPSAPARSDPAAPAGTTD